MSESDAPPTTYLPEGFTYLPSQVCPQRLPSMSKYIVKPVACFLLRLMIDANVCKGRYCPSPGRL